MKIGKYDIENVDINPDYSEKAYWIFIHSGESQGEGGEFDIEIVNKELEKALDKIFKECL